MTHTDGTVSIRVNGEHRRVAAGLTIAQLAADLGLVPEKVAVERNLEIVPRSTLGQVMIEDGDELEIVHFVGGGAMTRIEAYGLDRQLETVQLGPIEMEQALKKCREYYAFGGIRFETAEEALEKTMFGFSRAGDDDFIEISIAARDQISFTHEVRTGRAFLGIFGGVRTKEVNIANLSALEQLVRTYFSNDSALDAQMDELKQ